jgi:hypothetical protein
MDHKEWKKLFPGLEEEVNRYFTKTPCGDRNFSGVGRFEISPLTLRTLYVIPQHLEEEDLSEIDVEFNVGLTEIGEKYGVNLSLPYWAYRK